MQTRSLLLTALICLPLFLTACGREDEDSDLKVLDDCKSIGALHLPKDQNQVAVSGVEYGQWHCLSEDATKYNFQMTWFDANNYKGKVTYNFVYKKNQPETVFIGSMDEKTVKERSEGQKNAGRGILQLDTHVKDGKVYYHAIFRAGERSERTYFGLSQEAHQSLVNQYSAEGYQSKYVSVASVNGKKYYAAAFNKASAPGHTMKSSIKVSEWQGVFDANVKAGRSLVYRSAYIHNGESYYVAIFESRANQHTSKGGMTQEDLKTELVAKSNLGFVNILHLIAVEINGALRYSIAWSK